MAYMIFYNVYVSVTSLGFSACGSVLTRSPYFKRSPVDPCLLTLKTARMFGTYCVTFAMRPEAYMWTCSSPSPIVVYPVMNKLIMLPIKPPYSLS